MARFWAIDPEAFARWPVSRRQPYVEHYLDFTEYEAQANKAKPEEIDVEVTDG